MADTTPLTETEVRQLVNDWYRGLDEHVPTDQLLALLADEGLEMRFPEITVHNDDEFRTWYETTIIVRYFDEVHTLQSVDVSIADGRADVRVVTRWQFSTWDPPAPRSQRGDDLATQTWVVERSAVTGRPVILTYVVEALVPNDAPAS